MPSRRNPQSVISTCRCGCRCASEPKVCTHAITPGTAALCTVADGVDACLRAAREELRQVAHCIKIMGSGGVASPTDPIYMNQYREDEIRAIVRETAERGGYIVPTMIIIHVLVELGRQLGFPPASQEKAEFAFQSALSGLDLMRSAGVKVGFGIDLLGSTHVQECYEFTLRREVYEPIELLRQATSVNAEMMMLEGQIGCVAQGAHADLIVVDGDPLADIGLLATDGRNLRAIMRGGELVRDELG